MALRQRCIRASDEEWREITAAAEFWADKNGIEPMSVGRFVVNAALQEATKQRRSRGRRQPRHLAR